eukprot:751404-Amphidinium_carterae.1
MRCEPLRQWWYDSWFRHGRDGPFSLQPYLGLNAGGLGIGSALEGKDPHLKHSEHRQGSDSDPGEGFCVSSCETPDPLEAPKRFLTQQK